MDPGLAEYVRERNYGGIVPIWLGRSISCPAEVGVRFNRVALAVDRDGSDQDRPAAPG